MNGHAHEAAHEHPIGAPASAGRGRKALPDLICVAAAIGLIVFWWGTPQLHAFSAIFVSIVLEASFFVLIGSLVGGAIEVFVPRETTARLLPANGRLTVLIGAGLGMLLPVCECAIVPVVRRLLRKGVPLPAAVAFLLAGPIANPLVFASTLVAYQFDWRIALTRFAFGYAIAVSVALIVGRLLRPAEALVPEAQAMEAAAGTPSGGRWLEPLTPDRVVRAFVHAYQEFLDIGRFLVMGAMVASLAQTLVPRGAVVLLAENAWLGILLMMALAVLLNLCSEADAFVAASLRGVLPLPAQMAFMVLGPMVDLKLMFMYLSVFRKRAIVLLAGITCAVVFAAMWAFALLSGGLAS